MGNGRGLGCGVVADLCEAQVWTNHAVKQKKDILELAGRSFFKRPTAILPLKTFSPTLVNGSIIKTAMNTTVAQLNTSPIPSQP